MTQVIDPVGIDAACKEYSDAGTCLVYERTACALAENAHVVLRALAGIGEHAVPFQLGGMDLEACAHVPLEGISFFDIETTGLGKQPLFLIGVLRAEGDHLVIRQYFARDFDEEYAVLRASQEALQTSDLLVSYNGKSFDLPYIHRRADVFGITFEVDAPHVDLLHVARRLWKYSLPSCSLQSVEQHILGRIRYGDIPSSEIPWVYRHFVETGDTEGMSAIIQHNALDIFSLAELLVTVLTGKRL